MSNFLSKKQRRAKTSILDCPYDCIAQSTNFLSRPHDAFNFMLSCKFFRDILYSVNVTACEYVKFSILVSGSSRLNGVIRRESFPGVLPFVHCLKVVFSETSPLYSTEEVTRNGNRFGKEKKDKETKRKGKSKSRNYYGNRHMKKTILITPAQPPETQIVFEFLKRIPMLNDIDFRRKGSAHEFDLYYSLFFKNFANSNLGFIQRILKRVHSLSVVNVAFRGRILPAFSSLKRFKMSRLPYFTGKKYLVNLCCSGKIQSLYWGMRKKFGEFPCENNLSSITKLVLKDVVLHHVKDICIFIKYLKSLQELSLGIGKDMDPGYQLAQFRAVRPEIEWKFLNILENVFDKSKLILLKLSSLEKNDSLDPIMEFTNLQSLDVRGCDVMSFHLQTLTQMKYLDISGCKKLSKSAFNGLNNLKVLKMKACKMSNLDENVFRTAISNIVSLELVDGDFPELKESFIYSLKNLSWIKFFSSGFMSFERNYFGEETLRYLSKRSHIALHVGCCSRELSGRKVGLVRIFQLPHANFKFRYGVLCSDCSKEAKPIECDVCEKRLSYEFAGRIIKEVTIVTECINCSRSYCLDCGTSCGFVTKETDFQGNIMGEYPLEEDEEEDERNLSFSQFLFSGYLSKCTNSVCMDCLEKRNFSVVRCQLDGIDCRMFAHCSDDCLDVSRCVGSCQRVACRMCSLSYSKFLCNCRRSFLCNDRDICTVTVTNVNETPKCPCCEKNLLRRQSKKTRYNLDSEEEEEEEGMFFRDWKK